MVEKSERLCFIDLECYSNIEIDLFILSNRRNLKRILSLVFFKSIPVLI